MVSFVDTIKNLFAPSAPPAKTDAPVAACSAPSVEGWAVTPLDLDVMARTLWGECRGEPQAGQIAVAWVIRTRATWNPPQWWGKGVFGVCKAPWQFSCWSDAQEPYLAGLKPSNQLYLDAYTIASDVMTGKYADPTFGATHYKVTGTPAQWDAASTGKLTVQIGHHSFFKLGPRG